MKRSSLYLFALAFCLLFTQVQAKTVWLFEIDGAIGPATADFIARGLNDAQSQAVVELVVLRMDTPGGLDAAMRDIIKAIINSRVPVATYVAPSGARAASAGTYILYASHIAAMAPGTNLGAATPVQIGGIGGGESLETEEAEEKNDKDTQEEATDSKKKPDSNSNSLRKKVVNDAEAYLRSLAQLRGRNVEWAEQAVRDAASLSATEALEKKVIDLVADDVSDLLQQVHGRELDMQGTKQTLNTENAHIEVQKQDWRTQLLSIITDPNIAYLLMLLGVYGLFFELYNPGSIVPGVIGGIALLLALFAFQVLPINYAGLGLIFLGLMFMIAEAWMPGFGILGIGGMVAFVIGSVILMDTDNPAFQISYSLIGALAIASAALFAWVLHTLVSLREAPIVTGKEQMLGETGECLSVDGGVLSVYVHSETWLAQSAAPILPGQKIKVVAMDGLKLIVEPFEI